MKQFQLDILTVKLEDVVKEESILNTYTQLYSNSDIENYIENYGMTEDIINEFEILTNNVFFQ